MSASSVALAGDYGNAKYLFKGDKAPFNGTLIDDEGLRQIDVELLEKDVCEKKISSCSSDSSLNDWGWQGLFVGFFLGAGAYYAISH